jgi:hypothetical protein
MRFVGISGDIMRRRSTFMRVLRHGSIAAACISAANTGVAYGQVRLHSASEEAATSTLSSELAKARVAHLAALDAHRAYLVEALARERTLLVQRELAERDAVLTLALSKPRDESIKLLSGQINEEWAELAGGLPTSLAFSDFVVAARHVNALEIERAGLNRHRAALITMFEGKGGAGKYCDTQGQGPVQFTALDTIAEAQALSDVCDELATNTKQLGSEYRRAGAASSLIGDPKGSTAGQIGEALAEANEITAMLAAQNALVATVAKQVKALDSYYQCQLRAQTVDAVIRADAAAVQQALDTLASGDAKDVFDRATFTALWDTLVKTEVDPSCDTPAVAAPAPDAGAGSDAPSASDILAAVGQLDKYAAKDTLLALLRESALDIQGSALGEALTGLAAQPGEKPDSKTAQRAMAALRIFGQLDKLYRASEGRMPDTAGALVALADVRMRQATAKIEAGRLAELDRLIKLRVAALRQRAVLLAAASIQLQANTDAGLSGGLRRYAESVNRGAIPASVLANDMAKGRYLPWLDRERAVVDAAYGVLTPAADQLQAYGKGGITPDTIAQFLQAVGLGGIAVK